MKKDDAGIRWFIPKVMYSMIFGNSYDFCVIDFVIKFIPALLCN